MSGRDVLNSDQTGPMQLPMFMRARDLADSLTGTLDKADQPKNYVMRTKLAASKGRIGHGHGTGVYSDVEKHGVLNPVQLVHGTEGSLLMGQGHHRTAAASTIAEDTGRDMWMPVIHTDAREGSDFPVGAGASMTNKLQAIQDYREWSRETPAIGQDVGWQQQGEMASRPRISEFQNWSEVS